MNPKYLIFDTEYLNPNKEYDDENLYSEFQNKLEFFKTDLLKNIYSDIPKTYYKFGDGDYFFLNKVPRGSAKPGKRAIKKPYFMINHRLFVKGAIQNDYYMSLIPKIHTDMFEDYFKKSFDFPSEFVYGLTANRWLTSSTSPKIGLIGADIKLEIISNLMNKQEYREYLGVNEFTDYISIPQRFACDNFNKVYKNVSMELEKSSSELFLLGIGHIKSGLLSRLKEHSNAVFLDIGVGIDALAGVVNLTRPYFGNWTNFQLKNQKIYSKVDYLVNNVNRIDNIKLI